MRSLTIALLSLTALASGCDAAVGPAGTGGGPDAGVPGDSSGDGQGYHPPGFAAAEVHGLEMKLQAQDCRGCHGETLVGANSAVGLAPGCDGCHQEGWRTNCIYCHGGEESPTGAPPGDIDPNEVRQSFTAHTAHVTSPLTASTGCNQCHANPTDVLSLGHAFDDTATRAELDFSGGVAKTTLRTAASCSNNYCHGDGQELGTVQMAQTDLSCADCHGADDEWSTWLSLSGAHTVHLINPTMDCTSCHAGTTANDPAVISNPSNHINGAVTVLFSEGNVTINAAEKTCSGLCHLFPHINTPWYLLGGG